MLSKKALPGALMVVALTCMLTVSFAADGWLGATQRETFMTGKLFRFSFIAKGIDVNGSLVTRRSSTILFTGSDTNPANVFMHTYEQADEPDTFFVDAMVVRYPGSNTLFRFTSNPEHYPFGLINTGRGVVGQARFTGYIPLDSGVGVAFRNYSGQLFTRPFTDVPPDWFDLDITGNGTLLYLNGSSNFKIKKRTSLDNSGRERFDSLNAKAKIVIDDARLVSVAEVFSNDSTPMPLGIYSLSWADSTPVIAKAVMSGAVFGDITTLFSSP